MQKKNKEKRKKRSANDQRNNDTRQNQHNQWQRCLSMVCDHLHGSHSSFCLTALPNCKGFFQLIEKEVLRRKKKDGEGDGNEGC